MPNQRARNKTLVGAFVDTQLKARVIQLAHSRNTTVSHIVGDALRVYLDGQASQRNAAQSEIVADPKGAPSQDPQFDNTEEIWLL